MFCLSSPQQEAGGKYRGIKRYHLPRFQPQRERGPALFRGEADYSVLQSGCGAYRRGEGALQQGQGSNYPEQGEEDGRVGRQNEQRVENDADERNASEVVRYERGGASEAASPTMKIAQKALSALMRLCTRPYSGR